MSFLAASTFCTPNNTSAEGNEDTSTTTAGDYTLSVSTTRDVNLSLSVGDSDTMTVSKANVNVFTNSPGYKLFLSTLRDTTDLSANNISGVIAATSGTKANPTALTRGTWGYAIPSGTSHIASNGFDATYTEQTSVSPINSVFAAPSTISSPELIASSPSATSAEGDDYPIYYAVMANADTNPGVYSNSLAFTAVADAGTTESMTITPSTIEPNTATTITVATTMYSTAETLDATITMTNTVAPSTSTTLSCTKTSSTPLAYSCTVPASSAGTYTIAAAVPSYGKSYNAELKAAYPAPRFFNATTMQQFADSSYCGSATIPDATAQYNDTTGAYDGNTNYVPTVTVTDTRDNSTYTVKRLADGNCWMTQNLRLVGPRTLTSADSDVTTSYELPASSSDAWCTQYQDSSCVDTSHVQSSDDYYGAYYNWYTATASTGKYATTSTDVEGSVCPKGWHLPSSGSSSGDFKGLVDAGYSTLALLQKIDGGPAFNLPGIRYSSSNLYKDEQGIYQSRTAGIVSGSSYGLTINSDGTISPSSIATQIKSYGKSVRCISYPPDPQLTVDPNNGTWEGSTEKQVFTQKKGTTKTIPNPTSTTSYNVTYDGNGQGATYTDSSGAVLRQFSSWSLQGGGSISGTTYTFGSRDGVLAANYGDATVTLPTITKNGSACGWATDPQNGTQYAGGKSTQISGDTVFYAVCNSGAPAFYTTTYMHRMSSSICSAVTTPSSSATKNDVTGLHAGDSSYIPTRVLTDIRDSKTYTVKKLADGKCWITEDLKLVGSKTLTSTYSDVSSDFILTASDSSSWCYESTASCINKSMVYNSGSTVYYNWYAATAGTGNSSTADGVNATSSICPKNWKLPNQTSTSSGDYSSLITAYDSSGDRLKDQAGPALSAKGYKFGTSIYNTDSGHYWTNLSYVWSYDSTTYYSARELRLTASGGASISSQQRYYGLPIRCVAR